MSPTALPDSVTNMRKALNDMLDCDTNGRQFKKFWMHAVKTNGSPMSSAYKEDVLADMRKLCYARFDMFTWEKGRHRLVFDQVRAIDDIGEEVLDDMAYFHREVLGVRPNTWRTIVQHIKSFYDHLNREFTYKVPAFDHSRDLDVIEERDIPDAELKLVYARIEGGLQDTPGSPPYQGALATWLDLETGTRPGDMVALNVGDLRVSPEGVPSIRFTMSKVRRGHGVSISPRLHEELLRWLSVRPADVETNSLFVNNRGNRPAYAWFYSWVRKYTAGKCPYALRHTSGRKHMEQSGNILLVRDRLGHRDTKTTERYIKTRDYDDPSLYSDTWGRAASGGPPRHGHS